MGYYQQRTQFGENPTPALKALLIANIGVFFVQVLLKAFSPALAGAFNNCFALTPAKAIFGLHFWQFITYSFLHDTAGPLPLHLFFNMLMLWMFGREVEVTLGTRRFVRLYFMSALAGGIAMLPMFNDRVWGASAAVFGVMAVYARMFPDRTLLIWGILPMRARTMIFVLVGLEILFTLQGAVGGGVAHLAHIGGFIVGWYYLPFAHWYSLRSQEREVRREESAARSDAETRQRVDEILAKVSKQGIGSLTREERNFLDRASRNFRR